MTVAAATAIAAAAATIAATAVATVAVAASKPRQRVASPGTIVHYLTSGCRAPDGCAAAITTALARTRADQSDNRADLAVFFPAGLSFRTRVPYRTPAHPASGVSSSSSWHFSSDCMNA